MSDKRKLYLFYDDDRVLCAWTTTKRIANRYLDERKHVHCKKKKTDRFEIDRMNRRYSGKFIDGHYVDTIHHDKSVGVELITTRDEWSQVIHASMSDIPAELYHLSRTPFRIFKLKYLQSLERIGYTAFHLTDGLKDINTISYKNPIAYDTAHIFISLYRDKLKG